MSFFESARAVPFGRRADAVAGPEPAAPAPEAGGPWGAPAPAASVPFIPHGSGRPAWATASPDYEVKGAELQFLEVRLAPGQAIVAEAGAMIYKQPAITLETVFGDGSEGGGGFLDAVLGAGRRALTGASLFTTVFENAGPAPARLAFAAPTPGRILALDLAAYGGELLCQKGSFLAGERGLRLGLAFQRRLGAGLFGGEGFILQRLEGEGLAFIHAGGGVEVIDLAPGEALHVDAGCIAAFTAGIAYEIERVGGVKSMLFSGQGLFFAHLTGPGRVWVESMPFSRLVGAIGARLPARGGGGGSSFASGGSDGGGADSGGDGGGDGD